MIDRARVVAMRGGRDDCGECVLANECLSRDADGDGTTFDHDIDVAPKVLHRGEHLFREGEAFHRVFVVRSGAVKTYAVSANGEEQVVGFHGVGDIVGVDAIDTEVHATSAVVLDTSSVCALPFDKLCRLARRSPTVQQRLLGKLSRRIRTDESRVTILGQRSADQRIASFLLGEVQRLRARGYSANELNLAMPRADIASYLGLAVETVSRVFTRLHEGGVLEVCRSRIGILDAPALTALADDVEPSAARNTGTH